MKRIGNLYKDIITLENLQLADEKAQKGKTKQYGVLNHNKNKEANIMMLQELLTTKTFSTSPYDIFKVYEPKERTVYKLPYFPDRITHHAIMNILEPIFVKTFTADTYSCIKGRGIHRAVYKLKTALKDSNNTAYCLKLDVTKFYPSIDHQILKELLRKKFKDTELLWLLYEIIDSAPGLPIGNYLSQYLANFYLSYFDHWIKEEMNVKYYFRYADDMIILSSSKEELHYLLTAIKTYLSNNLNLQVKGNHQVFPVSSRGIDFVGYRFFHSHTLIRKSIKKNFARMVKKRPNAASIASYKGWLKHADTINLTRKLLMNEEI